MSPVRFRWPSIGNNEPFIAPKKCGPDESHTMKNRALVVLSLIIGTAALGHGVWLHVNIRQVASLALREREAQLVERLAPKVRGIVGDMTGDADALPTNPRTLEELFEPFATIIEGTDSAADDAAME